MQNQLILSIAAMSALGMGSLSGARGDSCAPGQPAPCYSEDCGCTYCYGPENTAGNPAVRPRTCNGDFVIEVAGFYWNAHQDGMEYAVENHVQNPGPEPTAPPLELNNLINAEYKTPDFDWDFGFKAGIGYNSACDGWDLGILWTWYKGKASDQVQAEGDDNRTLLPLWSAYAPQQGTPLYATDIETQWNLELNMIDLTLGREFWNSKRLTLRPHIGLRIARINQSYEIEHKGGSWSANTNAGNPDVQVAYNDFVDLDNNFKGVGIRAGLDSTWNFGCGWGLYGNFAASIVYGRFSLDHDETLRLVETPFSKCKILETKESFRASRAMLDLGLGLQWSTLFCGCQYGFTFQLGWENHMFFNQNQLWRVARSEVDFVPAGMGFLDLDNPNNTGENIFYQRRGDLDTQGWTLRIKFEF